MIIMFLLTLQEERDMLKKYVSYNLNYSFCHCDICYPSFLLQHVNTSS
jgi:hypothetical protein